MKIFFLSFFISSTVFAQSQLVTIDCSVKTGIPKNLLNVNAGPDNSMMGYKDIGIHMIRTHDYYGPCDYWTYTVNA